jgi:hypothetical protein
MKGLKEGPLQAEKSRHPSKRQELRLSLDELMGGKMRIDPRGIVQP